MKGKQTSNKQTISALRKYPGKLCLALTVTDELTLWTNNRAIWDKGQEATSKAFLYLYLLREMPFMIRSINTDKGAEFINYHLQRMLQEKHKRSALARSRPYRKNDNALAEERNRHKERELKGYERMEDERCVFLLNQVYRYHNLLPNLFIASRRKRNPATGKTRKQYDKARAPYERVLEHSKEGKRRKKRIELRESLDPIELEEKIEKALKRLFKHMFPERFLHE